MIERCNRFIKAPLKRQEQSEADQNEVTFKSEWTLQPNIKLVLEMSLTTLYWTTMFLLQKQLICKNCQD